MNNGTTHYCPLTQDEIRLIAACKTERQRLREEQSVLYKLDRNRTRKQHDEQRKQIRRELKELSNKKLAEKFEVTIFQIERIPGDHNANT